MEAKSAMAIGMEIAERHTAATLELFSIKPDATTEEALRGCQVWLAAEIMKALCEPKS